MAPATKRSLALAIALATGIGAAALTRAASGAGSHPRGAAAVPGWPVTECGTYSGRGCSPEKERVDLEVPQFSNPTRIDNPLFPISRLQSAVLLGEVEGKAFRSETTLLPGTVTVEWAGQHIPVLVSQYTAYLDGRIEEVALDRYAQADDGSVWYFGEDVFDYRDGLVAVTEGTWHAGADGPPAMIMPARPEVGDVFRSENIIGVVFEELRIKSVGETVDGPRGRVPGAIVAEELHLDGSHSDKVFAPGYGEFYTSSDGETEALAVAVTVDHLDGRAPAELDFLSTSAFGILENARLEDWDAAGPTLQRMQAAWKRLQSGDLPPLVEEEMVSAFTALVAGVEGEDIAATSHAALDVAQAALDLELQYRPSVEIDLERFHLHTQRLRVHAAENDIAGVAAEVAVLEWIRDRVTGALSSAALAEVDTRLRDLRGAVDARNAAAAADHAARLAARLRLLTT
jgi:hypothetical protein